MSASTYARIYLDKALGWERFVLLLSFWRASGMFLAVFVLGNFASHYLGLGDPIGLSAAGSWFFRALIGFAALGTLINVVCLAVTAASDRLGRKNSRVG